MRPNPLAFSCKVNLPPPSAEDRRADTQRLKDSLKEKGIHPLDMPLYVAKKLPVKLRENDFAITVIIGSYPDRFRLIDIGDSKIYGIALDIGTTTIECTLFDLNSSMMIAQHEIVNPQVEFGADVLTRIQLAMTGKVGMLSESLRAGVNTLVAGVCEHNNIRTSDIYAMTVAGNTAMTHFFLGLDVSYIPVSPNIPAINDAVFCNASDVGIDIFSEAIIYVFPNAGSYVGGDIISGIAFIGLNEMDEPALFMDVGTNVEVTLGCKDWIMTGAGAAGPAFEGGVADIGRKAGDGAINSIAFDSIKECPVFTVIGDTVPSGICGSGLIDLVAMLYEKGIIDQAGRFNLGMKGVVLRDNEPAYLLYSSGVSELVLRERELQNFLRTKAAMFAFLYVFLRSVGMKISDVKRIYVSGALGCGINIENAIKIGMLPDISRDKIIPIGNSSLKGACKLLLDSMVMNDVDKIVSLITYREMSEDIDLLNILQGALFIPHTDPEMLKG